MDEVTIKTYDERAEEYDRETADFWDLFPRSFISSFVERFKEPSRILDVGSGPGRDGSILYSSGLNVICLDASRKMVEMSKARGLLSVQGDFLHLPFEDSSFDGVWAYTALLHVPKADLPRALSEIRRVLKPGGIFGLGMIEGEGEGYRESSGVDLPRWFSYYQQAELEETLSEAGFEILNFESFTPRSKKYLNFLARKN